QAADQRRGGERRGGGGGEQRAEGHATTERVTLAAGEERRGEPRERDRDAPRVRAQSREHRVRRQRAAHDRRADEAPPRADARADQRDHGVAEDLVAQRPQRRVQLVGYGVVREQQGR